MTVTGSGIVTGTGTGNVIGTGSVTGSGIGTGMDRDRRHVAITGEEPSRAAHAMSSVRGFDHERMDVYQAALDFVTLAQLVIAKLPRG